MASDNGLLLDVKTVSKMLAISPRRLYILASMPGALPDGIVLRLGRSVRFSLPRLEAWLGVQAQRGADVRLAMDVSPLISLA